MANTILEALQRESVVYGHFNIKDMLIFSYYIAKVSLI